MTDDQLVEELHELKRRNETPIPLIEMFDALPSFHCSLCTINAIYHIVYTAFM